MKGKSKSTSKVSYILTRETMGTTLILFSAIIFIMLVTREVVFGAIGTAVCTFMYGTFGYGALLFMAFLAYLGVWLAFEKRIKIKFGAVLAIGATLLMAFCLFHAASTDSYSLENYGGYLTACYENAANGWAGYTFGGALSGLLVFPVANLTSFIGAYIIFTLLTLLCGYLAFFAIYRSRPVKQAETAKPASKVEKKEEEEYHPPVYPSCNDGPQNLPVYPGSAQNVPNYAEQQPLPLFPSSDNSFGNEYNSVPVYNSYPQPISPAPQPLEQPKTSAEDDDKFSQKNLGKKILFENGEFAAESYRRNMIFNEDSYFNHSVVSEEDYLSCFSSGKSATPKSQIPEKSYTESYQQEVMATPAPETPSNYVYGEKPVENLFDTYEEEHEGETPERTHSMPEPQSPAETYGEEIRADYTNPVEARQENPVNHDLNEDTTPAPAERPFVPEERREEPPVQQPPEEKLPKDSHDLFSKLFGNDSVRDSGVRSPERSERNENIFETPRSEERRESGRSERNENIFEAPRSEERRESGRSERNESIFETPRGEERRESGCSERNENIFEAPRSEERKPVEERNNENLFDDDNMDNIFGLTPEEDISKSPREVSGRSDKSETPSSGRERQVGFTDSSARRAPDVIPEPEPVKQEQKPKHVWKKYVRPSLDLLDDYPESNHYDTAEIQENKRIIVETLEKANITCEASNVAVGPAITRYDITILDMANINRAVKLKDQIAMALRKDNINAYLNYAKGALSIEVANNKRTIVGLKNMIASQEFINSKPNSLTFALGKDMEGKMVCPDITKMPHLLVAGATGSGKSICLSALLISLLYNYGPEDLRLILVDPKQVEFIPFDKLPHLMINEIISDVDKAIKALNWAISEMERRYSLFRDMTENGIATKNLDEYNSHVTDSSAKLPKILIILDEFGDLMLQAKKEIEQRIIKLAQKARACGIHLVLATQRPSVDCITGLIKSNMATRIGFRVSSFADSSTIFDVGGAEKLLSKGDMYFRSNENPDLARIQGCFVDTHEVQKVTDFIKANNETYFDEDVSDFINKVEENETSASGASASDEENGDTKLDETYLQALKYCITANQASVSMIQRRFPVGYIKACKIIDWMAKMNYITQAEGSKPRKILLSLDEFEEKYGVIDD